MEEDSWTRGLDEYEQEMVLKSRHCEFCGERIYGTEYEYVDSGDSTLLGEFYHKECYATFKSSQLPA